METSEQCQSRKTVPGPSPDGAPDKTTHAALAWLGRWSLRALACGAAIILLALAVFAARWLYAQRKVDQAMELVATSARATLPPPAVRDRIVTRPPAQQQEEDLPPLVLLAPEPVKAVPAKPAVRMDSAARKKKTHVQTKLAAATPKPASKGKRTAALATAKSRAPVRSARVAATPKRCRTGELARDCLADLCRAGRKAACLAGSGNGLF